ncbi:uncharacterized protein LOC119398627 [Rhipicephalus sanguineus]|uniref:uncharacterized protein LOC119398627 n=1 Tax=Rhipicephalus sanguineus TaxID=34632 RepID=UPI00189464E9|nr:uncharacterized protein LOC119398627 [Rhipicephalus sanguineus]
MSSTERLRKDPDTEAREVNRQVAVLKTKEAELRQLDKDILDLTEDEAIEGEVEGACDYHEKILYAIADAQFFLSQRQQATGLSGPSRSEPNDDRVAATQSNIGSAEAPPGPVSTPRYRSVGLPTLQVPTYAGDLRQWQEFWDHYSATIHENTELPPIEKFKYLLTYLPGAAKRAIEGIRLADNYEIAVTTLKDRFGRQELLVNEQIDQLLALSPVRSSKEVEKLRVLHDTARFRVSALQGLGVPPEQYIVVLHRVLMRCLPEDLRIMYRQKKKEESTRGTNASAESTPPEARTHKATDILAFLKIQVEVREEGKQEAASSYTQNSITEPGDMSSPTRSSQGIPSASALAATESLQQRTPCVLCDSRGHGLAECTVDLYADEKRARLLNARCCYKCRMRNHVARFCRVSLNLTCNKCQRRHLTVLCELSRAVNTTAAPTPTVPGGSSGSTSPTVTTASTSATEAKSVLLQTGRVWAESGPRELLVRVMLDSGSQRSFIRTDVSKRLQCKVIGREELSLVTFGNAKPRNHLRCRRVSVTLRGHFNGSTVALEALEVPEVCTVTSPPLNIEVLELLSARRYDAADMFDPETWHPEDVSILIGSDAYWKVATGKNDRLNEQLTAVETSFGWTVQGSSSHYEATEPGIPAGSDNRQLAARRLNLQLKRFREQPDLLKQYVEAITAYFKDGHAERVDQEQIPGPNIYYMPHHAVIRRDAVSTKLRVVFDASSHVVAKPCLNDVLSKGVKLGVGHDNVAIETETGDDHLMKVLGVPWERKGDTIALTVRNAASFATNSPATKRTILQTVARVYDPLGYLSPFTVKGKLIFQDLWKRKHSWDDTLPDEIQAAWNAWCAELPEFQAQIPRYVFLHNSSAELAFELYIFTDASAKAYGACIYVRALSADGACVTRLLISRSRVAPLQTMYLPRLELIACVSGARLAKYVRSVPLLQQASARFWTDSLVPLHWIRAKRRNRDLFISNRVAEISKLTNPDTWAHCSSGENPADLLTRGVSAKALLESDKWWHGPP